MTVQSEGQRMKSTGKVKARLDPPAEGLLSTLTLVRFSDTDPTLQYSKNSNSSTFVAPAEISVLEGAVGL